MTCDESRIEELEAAVEELTERLDEKDEKIDELTNTIGFLKDSVFSLEDNVYGEYDSAGAGSVTKKRGGIFDRVDRLESQDVDLKPQDVISAGPDDSLIPIQQMYNACKNGAGDSLSKNKRLAALVWPHYRKYADPTGGTLTLRSPKVKELLRDEVGVDDPNPNTVRRVMRFVAEFSGKDDEQFIEFDTDSKVNVLECSRQDWKDVTGKMLQSVQQSGRSAVATDGGEPTR